MRKLDVIHLAVPILGLTLALPFGAAAARAADEEAAILQLVERFFSAFAKKDLDSAIACWSTDSPQFAAVKESLQTTFRLYDDVQNRNFRFSKWDIRPDRASVRVRFDWEKLEFRNKPPVLQQMIWDVHFVKKGAVWLWSERSDALVELARAL